MSRSLLLCEDLLTTQECSLAVIMQKHAAGHHRCCAAPAWCRSPVPPSGAHVQVKVSAVLAILGADLDRPAVQNSTP